MKKEKKSEQVVHKHKHGAPLSHGPKEPTCPNCGSTKIQIVTEGHTKGYDAGSGCCGAILFGPLGLLCGACGMGGKSQYAKRMCLSCGKKF